MLAAPQGSSGRSEQQPPLPGRLICLKQALLVIMPLNLAEEPKKGIEICVLASEIGSGQTEPSLSDQFGSEAGNWPG